MTGPGVFVLKWKEITLATRKGDTYWKGWISIILFRGHKKWVWLSLCQVFLYNLWSFYIWLNSDSNNFHKISESTDACHFLSREYRYSDKSRREAGTEGVDTSDEYLQSRRKCFHFMSHLTSHINKVRTGEEAEREAEEDRLTFDRWWLVNPWGTTLPACTPWVTAPASPPPLSPFFFSISFAVLSDKAPRLGQIRLLFVVFFIFFPMIAWQWHLSDSSSSGEVVLKCCATLATSPTADPQAHRETNPFILPSTFRWGGGRLLHGDQCSRF